MFMFGNDLEVIDLKLKVSTLEEKVKQKDGIVKSQESVIREKEWTISKNNESHAFKIEKAKFEMAKELEKRLIESDIQRVEAIAKLKTYQEMDTKEERKHTMKMLERAIESLGVRQQINIQK